MTRRLLPALLLVLTACGGTALEGSAVSDVDDRPFVPVATSTTQVVADDSPAGDADGEDRASDLTARTQPLGSALLSPVTEAGPKPTGLTVEALDITSAPIVDVGVEPNGEMEIPGAREIGWYRFGPVPGESGSAVLAAHIAFDGRDGIFRDLADLEVGDTVDVSYDDGSSKRFRITETAQYAKDELPIDRVFAKDGESELTLITCGGDFNRSLRSYSDNVVAYAEPIDG